ncbi:MAG: hypothetical protein QM820_39175 [Minicystis sp.]
MLRIKQKTGNTRQKVGRVKSVHPVNHANPAPGNVDGAHQANIDTGLSADHPSAPLVAPLPSAELEQKNALIQNSYKAFMPNVGKYLDCGLKVQGLLLQLRNDLQQNGGDHTVDEMGLTVRIVRSKRKTEEIALRGGWSGEYHVYLRCEDDAGNDYLYDPYINAGNCRGTTAESSALPNLWATPMEDMEFFSVAGVGTDIPISQYMSEYEGKWLSLVEHAIARGLDPTLAGTFEDWYM